MKKHEGRGEAEESALHDQAEAPRSLNRLPVGLGPLGDPSVSSRVSSDETATSFWQETFDDLPETGTEPCMA